VFGFFAYKDSGEQVVCTFCEEDTNSYKNCIAVHLLLVHQEGVNAMEDVQTTFLTAFYED
jgi:hypothetical protein